MRVQRKLESGSKGPFVMKYFKHIFKNRKNSIINPPRSHHLASTVGQFISSIPTPALITHTCTNTHKHRHFEAKLRHPITSYRRIFNISNNLCHSNAMPPQKSLTQTMAFSSQCVLNIAVPQYKVLREAITVVISHMLQRNYFKKSKGYINSLQILPSQNTLYYIYYDQGPVTIGKTYQKTNRAP